MKEAERSLEMSWAEAQCSESQSEAKTSSKFSPPARTRLQGLRLGLLLFRTSLMQRSLDKQGFHDFEIYCSTAGSQ